MSHRENIPVLPLRDVVVYPHMVIPLFVGREKSISALDAAMDVDKHILLVAQRSPETDDPKREDLYEIGTLSTVLQLLKLPDGTIKVLVEGGYRASVDGVDDMGDFTCAEVREIESDALSSVWLNKLSRSKRSMTSFNSGVGSCT